MSTPDFYTLSLPDALPICPSRCRLSVGSWIRVFHQRSTAMKKLLAFALVSGLLALGCGDNNTGNKPGGTGGTGTGGASNSRSEEHTSELQSHSDLVCRLLL